jgi:hypothetical protein
LDADRESELENLREFAKTIIRSMKNTPFNLVVEAVTGFKIIPVDLESDADRKLVGDLAEAANAVMVSTQKSPIIANRSNDVATPLERLFLANLARRGIAVSRPRLKGGRQLSSAYPDLQLTDAPNRVTYIEVKNSRPENIYEPSARNFFFKASEETKITADARHLIMGFINEEVSEKKWRIIGWKLVDLYDLRVNFKPEFNIDNPAIYAPKNIVIQANLDANGKIIITRGQG